MLKEAGYSPEEQRELRRREALSHKLEQLSPDEFTSADLKAVLAVSGLGPTTAFARNQAYAHLERRAKACTA